MRTKYLGTMAILAVALTVMALPVSADLVATTFGFPVIVQNGSTSSFNQDTANASDLENIAINFPAYADGLNLGPIAATVGAGVGIGNGTGVGTDDTRIGAGVGATVTSNVLPFGPVNLAFPDISQTVDQTQDVTHTDFAQTNEYAEFAYPFDSVGSTSLPGFGFGF